MSDIQLGHRCGFLLTDKGVYSWGNNTYGELGTGKIDQDLHYPKLINFPPGPKIRSISIGYKYGFALDINNNVYGWGQNEAYQLGIDNRENQPSPVILNNIENVYKIFCTEFRTYALTLDGHVYAWGSNFTGRLGLDTTKKYITIPTKMIFPTKLPIKNLFCGNYFVYAIDSELNVFSWGVNYNNILCVDNFSSTSVHLPEKSSALSSLKIKKISCGDEQVLFLTTDNKLYISKSDIEGVDLGNNRNICKLELVDVQLDIIIDKIYNFEKSFYFIDILGDMYAWGLNNMGQLGVGDTNYKNYPTKILTDVKMKVLAMEDYKAYSISTNGDLYKWGYFIFGKDVEDDVNFLTPKRVTYYDRNNINIRPNN